MQGPPAKPPINKANVIVWLLLGPLVLGGVGYWWMHRTERLSVLDAKRATSGRIIVVGEVVPSGGVWPMQLGTTVQSAIGVRDATGTLVVYFDPSEVHAPANGARVQVTGRKVQVQSDSRTELIADEIVATR